MVCARIRVPLMTGSPFILPGTHSTREQSFQSVFMAAIYLRTHEAWIHFRISAGE
jgi:hypothetical protein